MVIGGYSEKFLCTTPFELCTTINQQLGGAVRLPTFQLLFGLIELGFQLDHACISSFLTCFIQELLIGCLKLLSVGYGLISGSLGSIELLL